MKKIYPFIILKVIVITGIILTLPYSGAYAQNSPGGNVTDALSFIEALGGAAYAESTENQETMTIRITENIILDNPVVIQSGNYELIPDEENRTVSGNTGMDHLFMVLENASLTMGNPDIDLSSLIVDGGNQNGITGGSCLIHNLGALIIRANTVIRNFTGLYGAILNDGENANLTMFGGNILTNTSTADGGAIYNKSGIAEIYGGEISGNTAVLKGGGIFNNGTLTIHNGNITSNNATEGGGIYLDAHSSATINGGKITDNQTGILVNGGSLILSGSPDLSGNSIYLKKNNFIHIERLSREIPKITVEVDDPESCTVLIRGNTSRPQLDIRDLEEFSFNVPDNLFPYLSEDKQTIVLFGKPTATITETCYSYYYSQWDSTFTENTIVLEYETEPESCGSLVENHIIIKQDHRKREEIGICKDQLPYLYSDTLLADTGTYLLTYTGTEYCDSIIIVQLKLRTIQDTVNLTICENELPYLYRDSLLAERGTYHFILNDGEACDTTQTLHLNVVPLSLYYDTLLVCENDFPVIYGDTLFAESGDHQILLKRDSDCDSIINLHIHNIPVIYRDTIKLCTKELPLYYGDSIFNRAGDYEVSFNSRFCDSIVRLHFRVYPEVEEDQSVSLDACDFPYSFGDSIFENPGTYFINHHTTEGCDSVILLTLNLLSRYDTVTICRENLPYQYGDSIITAPGNYTITFTPSGECQYTVNLTLRLFNQEKPVITGDTDLCISDTSVLSVLHGQYLSHQWSTGETTGKITVRTAGSYHVTCLDENGCENLSDPFEITSRLETGINGNVNICPGDTAHLSAYGGTYYHWSTLEETADISITESGTYQVTVSNNPNCFSINTVEVKYLPAPDLTITENQRICIGENTTLQVQDTAPLSSFIWSTNSSSPAITIEPRVTTVYSVTATNIHECKATLQTTVKALPEITIGGNTVICKGEAVQLTATGGNQYEWSDGQISETALFSPLVSSTYHVIVRTADNCTGSKTIRIEVKELPEPIIFGNPAITSGNLYLCQGDTATLTADGGTDYLWSTGETGNMIRITRQGRYTVTASDEHGCSGKTSVIVNMKNAPIPHIDGELSFCEGNSTELRASGGSAYQWNTNATTPAITVSQSGLYTVTVSNTEGCTVSATALVTVIPKPVFTVTGDRWFCRGESTTLIAKGTGCNFLWDNEIQDTSLKVYQTGSHTVIATNEAGCSATANITVGTIDPVPCVVRGNLDICEGETTGLAASGGIGYQWSTGENSPVITVSNEGLYSVTATDLNGCRIDTFVRVTMKRFSPAITGRLTFCEGDSSVLTVQGGSHYSWNNGITGNRILVKESGIYTATVEHDGCTKNISVTVNVNPAPQLNIKGNNRICEDGKTYLIAEGIGDYTYRWNDNSSKDTLLVYETGEYGVTATNDLGCKADASIIVTLYPALHAEINGNTSICKGEESQLTASGGSYYRWNTNAETPAIKVTESGTYRVTVSDTYGCSKSVSATVTVTEIIPRITGKLSFCEGESTTLLASGGTGYEWSNGKSDRAIVIREGGIYQVTVTDHGCHAETSAEVVMLPAPVINILGNRTFCADESTILTATQGNYTYQWNQGSTSNTITVNTPGSYTVTVKDEQGCKNSTTAIVNTLPLPTAVIDDFPTLCEGEHTILKASGGNTYLWNTGETSPYLRVETMGTYTVTVTGSNGCHTTKDATVVVNPLPVILIEGKREICKGESVTLTASGGNSYLWSSGQNHPFITVYPENTTTYSVYVKDVNGCENMESVTVEVNLLPEVYISGDPGICEGGKTELTASRGARYLWNTGQQTREIEVTEAQEYSVSVYTDEGCYSSANITTTINPLPDLAVTGNTVICEGQQTELTASGGSFFIWSTGEQTASIIITQDGEYSVTAFNDFGCGKSTSVNVRVNPLPYVEIIGQDTICEGEQTTFYASSNEELSYLWNTESITSYIPVSEANVYSVTVTNDNDCRSTAYKTLVVKPKPPLNITGDLSVCPGFGTTLTAHGGSGYTWSDGKTSAENIVFPTNGYNTYTVTATGSNGCSASASVTVTIHPPGPSFTITGPTSFCEGKNITLSAVDAASVVWSTGSTTKDIVVDQPGTYTVTVSNSFGCSSSNSIQVITLTPPIASIEGETELCDGLTTLWNASGGTHYLWSTGERTSGIEISLGGNYTVTVTDDNGCSSTESRSLTILEKPLVIISGNAAFCQGDSTLLTAESGSENRYLWNTGIRETDIMVTNPGTYTVTVTNENGCSVVESREITMNSLPVASITGNTIFCDGTSSTLIASGGIRYSWNTGEETETIRVNEAALFSVTVTNEAGCSVTASTRTDLLEAPSTEIKGLLAICRNDTSIIYAGEGPYDYLWNTGEETSSIEIAPQETSVYSVTVTNGAGCSSVYSETITVHPSYHIELEDDICQNLPYTGYGFSLPVQDSAGIFRHTKELLTASGCDSIVILTLTVKPKPVLQEEISGPTIVNTEGHYHYSIGRTLYAEGFQWSISNPGWTISDNGSSAITLHITSRGSGTLTVLAANECGLSSTSALQINSSISVTETDPENEYSVFPNPATTFIQIHSPVAGIDPIEVELTDMNGKKVKYAKSINDKIYLNIADLSSGTYILNIIRNGQLKGSRKILKL